MTRKEETPAETPEERKERQASFASELRAMKAECPEAFDRLRETLRNCGFATSGDVPKDKYPMVRTWYALFRKGASR